MVVTEEKTRNTGKKRPMKIVATTSLPAVDDPNAEHWNAAGSCQKQIQQTVWTLIFWSGDFLFLNVKNVDQFRVPFRGSGWLMKCSGPVLYAHKSTVKPSLS